MNAAEPFWEAGFTHLAIVQIGGDHQEEFPRDLRVGEALRAVLWLLRR